MSVERLSYHAVGERMFTMFMLSPKHGTILECDRSYRPTRTA